MSERKVLTKYYPPDFDPSKIPRLKRPVDLQQKVRLMAPFSMRCLMCGEWIAKGKKFNARKENVQGEKYLGIQIYRFYIRCPRCSGEITFKTDPQNSDYACEQGAARNFEPWRDASAKEEEAKTAREQEEDSNPMKALENRTADSRRELQIMNALEDLRSSNAAKEKLGKNGDLLEWFYRDGKELELGDAIEEELEIQAIFGSKKRQAEEEADETTPKRPTIDETVKETAKDEAESSAPAQQAPPPPVARPAISVPLPAAKPAPKLTASLLGIKVKPKTS